MKKIAQLLFFPGLLLLLLFANLFVDQPKLYENKQIHSRNRNYAGIQAQKQNIDMLILGDSEGYTTISPLQIWHDHGVPAFNCSMTGQNIVETAGELAIALKQHDVKLVLMETNLLFRYEGQMKTAQLILAEQIYRLLPVLRYHSTWKTTFYTAKENKNEEDWPKGFHITTGVAFQEAEERQEDTDQEVFLEPLNLRYLKKIEEMCRAEGAQLIFYSSPSPRNYSKERIAFLTNLCEQEKIPYVCLMDHMEDMGLDLKVESYDGGDHLNISGAAKVTKFMGNYLAENYDLPDHRKDPAYEEWNTESSAYRKKIRKMLRKVKKNAASKEAKAAEAEEEAAEPDSPAE